MRSISKYMPMRNYIYICLFMYIYVYIYMYICIYVYCITFNITLGSFPKMGVMHQAIGESVKG